jgi:hypothetical protein
MKTQILKGLQEFRAIDYSDFNQVFDGSRYTSDTTKFEIEGNGFTIELELTEHVIWENHEWNNFDDYTVESFTVYDINGDEIDTEDISENEILANI